MKNVNPSTPLVYPNRRFHKTTLRQTQTPTVFATPQLLTSLQSQIKELVPPRLLSARQTPSFLSRRRTTRQVNKIQGRHTATAHKQRKEARCSSMATVSSALGDTAVQFLFRTLDTTPLSRCLDWETRFQVSNTQPSLKGCCNNSKLL